MRFKKLFLPLGIILAIVISLIEPMPGIIIGEYRGISISVILIFLVYGYTNDFLKLRLDRVLILVLVLGAVISLLIGPLVGLLISTLLLPGYAVLGLMVASCMPPTLSSGAVLTDHADGNTLLAILLTVFINILAILVVPVTIHVFLGSIESVDLSPVNLFFNLLYIVLIPMALGNLLRIINSNYAESFIIEIIPTICVVGAIWICVSKSSASILDMNLHLFLMILSSVIAVHLILMILSFITGALFKFHSRDKKALAFVTSQKTLPIAAFVILTIAPGNTIALITCVVFQVSQILLDSFIASRMS